MTIYFGRCKPTLETCAKIRDATEGAVTFDDFLPIPQDDQPHAD